MATIFPREEKAEALFGEILKNPEACHRLMDTFNDSLDMADVLAVSYTHLRAHET